LRPYLNNYPIPDSLWGTPLNLAGDTTFEKQGKYLRKPIDVDSSDWKLFKVEQKQGVYLYTYFKAYFYGIEEGYIEPEDSIKKWRELQKVEDSLQKIGKGNEKGYYTLYFPLDAFGWSDCVGYFGRRYLRSTQLLTGCAIKDTIPTRVEIMGQNQQTGKFSSYYSYYVGGDMIGEWIRNEPIKK
jgi:hypothetical protein